MTRLRFIEGVFAAILASGACAADGASAYEAAVAADPGCATGIFRPYPFPEVRDTPPPEGYRPFYVSHYGRHGCRHLRKESEFAAVDALKKADGAGALSACGKELLAKLSRIKAAHEGMLGELAARGAREHRLVARRMYARFPGVFSGGGRARCQASTRSRCHMSMANFMCELRGLAPELDFELATGERFMATILNHPSGEERPYDEIEAAKKRLLRAELDPKPFADRVFSNVDAAAVGDMHEFANGVFRLAAICRPLSAELGGMLADDCFTADEWAALGRAMNGVGYMYMGGSTEFGDGMIAAAKPLAADFARRADEAIAGSGIVADFRFGHDSGLWPFACFLGLEGPGDRVPYSEVCAHESLWRCMPKAANIQIVFFRGRGGDVVAKVLYNEEETRVRGLEPVSGVFYRWPELKARLTGDGAAPQ